MKRTLLLAAVLLLLPLTSYAQLHVPERSDNVWLAIEHQTVHMLSSPHDTAVLQALENTALFTLLCRDKINLKRTVDPLIALHKKHPNPEVRQQALSTLILIGSDRALMYARRVNAIEREQSRTLALGTIDTYFARHNRMTAQR